MPGKYISRICIIYLNPKPLRGHCLYDRIWPGDEDLWLSHDAKYDDDDEYAMGIKFAVSGTKKERTMRSELIALLTSFFQISRSLDGGDVFKACFQLPAGNRQSNFTVKFTPHFGTLARPKKHINTKISSMVFGQSQTEMIIASKIMPFKTKLQKKNLKKKNKLNLQNNNNNNNNDLQPQQQQPAAVINNKKKKKEFGEFICSVFYGVNCKPEIASDLAKKLISEFFNKFPNEIQRLLIRFDRDSHNLDNDNSGTSSNSDLDDLDFGDIDKNNKNKHQEYIMATFKSFDEIAVRLQTRHIDRTQNRKRINLNNRKRIKNTTNTTTAGHVTTSNTNNNTNNNNQYQESSDEEEIY